MNSTSVGIIEKEEPEIGWLAALGGAAIDLAIGGREMYRDRRRVAGRRGRGRARVPDGLTRAGAEVRRAG